MNHWGDILGHEPAREHLELAIRNRRLATTFLFCGPPGVGKRLIATRLAQALLCEENDEHQFIRCGECASCQQVASGSHMDLVTISKPSDKSAIPLELLIGRKEKRMQEGLCFEMSLKPTSGRRKIAIIDDADDLNLEGANALLKTLEEPPPKSLLVLIGTSTQRQLPTIRSRCQILRFQPLATRQIEVLLRRHQVDADDAVLRQAALWSDGSLESARLWLDDSNRRFREDWLGILAEKDPLAAAGVSRLTEQLEAAGKDTWGKRSMFRMAITVALDFYSQCLRGVAARPDEPTGQLGNWTDSINFPPLSVNQLADCLDRSERALGQLAANVNLPLLADDWLGDLSLIYRGQFVSA